MDKIAVFFALDEELRFLAKFFVGKVRSLEAIDGLLDLDFLAGILLKHQLEDESALICLHVAVGFVLKENLHD